MNDSKAVLMIAVVALALAFVSPVIAQEEPTPVVETETEELAVEPEPTAVPEPAEPEPQEATVPKVYREKTLITIDGRAEMNGYVELVVTPNNEEPTKVRANVVAKTKKKKITKALTEQLIFALGDRYKVKQTGDRTISIKSKKKMPPLAVELKSQNLAGVSVMISQG